MRPSHPLTELLRRIGSNASGEFVCASSEGELHVFLQEGRIAWATNSKHPLAFGAHLQQTAGIEVDALRRLIEECRREKLPLGQTLVDRGLTSVERVRDSLSHQVGLAISLLASLDEAPYLFLERRYQRYDVALTFDVRDFVLDRASPEDASVVTPAMLTRAHALAVRLRALVDGLVWTEVFQDTVCVGADPLAPSDRTPRQLIQSTTMDGADIVAIRSAQRTLIGLRIDPLQSVWCLASSASTVGATIAAVMSVVGASERTSEQRVYSTDITPWFVESGKRAFAAVLARFMCNAFEALGAVVLGADPGTLRAACGRVPLNPDDCVRIARRRQPGFSLSRRSDGPLGAQDDGSRADLKTLVSGEATLWCFGAELSLATGDTLWLFLDRRSSQGLGWAYVAALKRVLAAGPRDGGP